MLLDVIIVIVSLFFVIVGADKLVDGASAIARRFGISEFVIGLTIVGFGTSCPELVVSLTGALEGLSAVSLGNVVGSNIFNTLLILGITAVLSPIAITTDNRRRDIPITVLVTVLLLGCACAGMISRWAGAFFLLLFAVYIFICFKFDSNQTASPVDSSTREDISMLRAVACTVLGLAFLVVGGKFFVDKSVEIARMLNVSEKFIAVTLLAGGTSLPELVTCIVAAARKKGQLALGNILGSNVFNILLILGCSALVSPIDCSALDIVDLTVLFASALWVLACSLFGHKGLIDRWEGAAMLLFEAAYMAWLVYGI